MRCASARRPARLVTDTAHSRAETVAIRQTVAGVKLVRFAGRLHATAGHGGMHAGDAAFVACGDLEVHGRVYSFYIHSRHFLPTSSSNNFNPTPTVR